MASSSTQINGCSKCGIGCSGGCGGKPVAWERLTPDPNTMIRCTVCGSSCLFQCMERHVTRYYACHNRACPMHNGASKVDPYRGVIYPSNAPHPAYHPDYYNRRADSNQNYQGYQQESRNDAHPRERRPKTSGEDRPRPKDSPEERNSRESRQKENRQREPSRPRNVLRKSRPRERSRPRESPQKESKDSRPTESIPKENRQREPSRPRESRRKSFCEDFFQDIFQGAHRRGRRHSESHTRSRPVPNPWLEPEEDAVFSAYHEDPGTYRDYQYQYQYQYYYY